MTMIEAGRLVEATRLSVSEPSRTCECLHVDSADEGMSGHEFVALALAGIECDRPTRWHGYWECVEGHLHVTAICDECRPSHDADTSRGGTTVEWMAVQ